MSYTEQELGNLLSSTIDPKQEKMINDLNSKFPHLNSDYSIATPNEVFVLGLNQEKGYIYQSS